VSIRYTNAVRLITGPAGSGKTSQIVDELRTALREGRTGVRLLVPTATLSQHLQNLLAREGFVLRKGAIQTLTGFVRELTPDLSDAPDTVLYLIVEEAAKKVARSIRTRPRPSAVKKANSALTSSEGAPAGDRRVQVEQKLVPTGTRLKAAIAASLATASDMPLPRRKNIQEILAQTIPDPAEIGLE